MDIPLYKVWDSLRREWFDGEAQARYVLDNARSRLELMFFLAPAGVVLFADGSLGLVDKADGYRWAPLDPERFKVVWWSGKKDKNGEPLYCNDMVRSPLGKLPWYIFVQDGQFMRRAVYDGELIAPIDYSEEDLVKVGSLYEHPEMGAES